MHHFLAFCLSTPWALQPERMTAYAAVLAARYAGTAPAAATERKARNAPAQRGAIAVVPVYGTIVQRANQLDLCEGGTSTQDLSAALRAAAEDPSVGQILLDIDSPGGSVFGVAELAAEIRSIRAQKPVVAIANSLAASAGYWIGAAAGEFYCTPGGEVGSIGVWSAHEDWSKAMEAAGVNITLFSAGKFKTEGNPYGPMSDDGKAFAQQRVEDYYAAFTRDVAKGRGVGIDQVRNGMGQGRCLGADQALAEQMVDGVMTFDEVVAKMQRAQPPKGRSALKAARNELEILG